MIKLLLLFPVAFYFILQAEAQPYTRDYNFGLGINLNNPIYGGRTNNVLFLPEGKLLLYGNYADPDANIYRHGMVQFFPNGQIDPSFAPPHGILPQETRIMVPMEYGYWVMNSSMIIYKLNKYGDLMDTTYTTNFIDDVLSCGGFNPVFLHDNSVILGGGKCEYPWDNPTQWLNLLKVLPNGRIDSTFQNYPNDMVLYTRRYDESRLLLAGKFTAYDGNAINYICRVDTLGNFDPTFQSIFTSMAIYPIHIQPDGKIIITGSFTLQNIPELFAMVRINPDGSLDNTFNNFNSITTGTGQNISSVCPTSDGGYLVGGSFSEYQEVERGCIAKTDADGFIDLQYFTESGIDSAQNLWNPSIYNINRGPNDQYYITGRIVGFNGEAVQPIIRLNGPLTVGIETTEAKKAAVSVQPNPARERVTVILPSDAPISGPCSLQITDLAGREIILAKFSGASANVDISQLPHGLYLVTITNAHGLQWQQKLVVQR